MKRSGKGFTLIETLLVIGVILSISMIKMKDIKDENESIRAEVFAKQIKTVAQATNALLVLKYDELSRLASSGIVCDAGSQTCNVSINTLNSYALLPPNFSSKTILGSTYEIQIKRTGVAPNYMFSGVVLTKGYEGSTASPLFLGKTLNYMGQDGGINRDINKIAGFGGSWSADQTTLPILTNKKNYIGSAVGSLSGAYYIYLRRDGALPMTGELNLDGNNIKNVRALNATGDLTTTANISGNSISASSGISAAGNISAGGNITATGSITSNSNISANGQVFAKNGYGDQIILGGDAGGADYEIKLGSAKPLTIFSPNAASYTTVLQTGIGNVQFNQRLGLMGTNPNVLPSGWSGGLTTLDIYANGTVGLGSGGGLAAYINSAGNIYASNNITSNTVNANGIRSNGDMSAGGNFSSNTVYSNYIKSNGNLDAAGSSWIGGNLNMGGSMAANGRITSGEYMQINGVANEGWGCSPNGLVGRNWNGALLSCNGGVWRKAGGSLRIGEYAVNLSTTTFGAWDFCFISYMNQTNVYTNSQVRIQLWTSGGIWYGIRNSQFFTANVICVGY